MASILIRDNETDDLPPVCAQCGEPASDRITKVFSWHPPWIAVTILAGLLIYIILAMVLTKRMTVRVPFCGLHRNHWSKRNLIIGLSAAGIAALGILSFVLVLSRPGNNDELFGFVCLGSALVFLVWVIFVAVLQSTSIRPTEITDRTITLRNVSDAFADAVEDADFKPRRRLRRYDDDDRDDYRRRPRPGRGDDDDDERVEGGPPPLPRFPDNDEPPRSDRPRNQDDDLDERIRDRPPR
jgi:hypothetical protein